MSNNELMAAAADPAALEALHSLRDWLRYAVTRFNQAELAFGHGSHNAYDEAAYLLTHALSLPLEKLEVFLDARLMMEERARIAKLLHQRTEQRVPAAYLTREAWLGEYRFYVDERAIIPRSFIAELMREDLAPWIADTSQIEHALDICTGSGCLAILTALTFARAQVEALDVSTAALEVAQINVAQYALQERVLLLQADLFEQMPARRYDLILANPPYVGASAMAALPGEYLHEPQLALASGVDGLDHTRRIIEYARTHLKPDGVLVVEIGDNRAALEAAYPNLAFTWLPVSGGDDLVFLLRYEDLG